MAVVLNSVANSLKVLEYLVEHGEGGISEMARALEQSPGGVYRLVSTLAAAGFANQNPETRKYLPGTKLLELANTMRQRVEFLDLAHVHLERLMRRADETVNFGVLRGDDVVYVDRVLTDRPMSVEVRIGSRVPAYCTALGKVLVAHADPAFRESYLERLQELIARQEGNGPSRKVLERELAKARSKGYAEDHGEFSPDIACAAAPVLNSRGRAVAAVSVSGPFSRFTAGRETLIPMVEIAGKELTLLLQELGEDDPRL